MKPLRFIPSVRKTAMAGWRAASPKSQGMYSASVRLSEYTLALETLEKRAGHYGQIGIS